MEADNILEKIHTSGLKFLVPLSLEETYKTIVDEAKNLITAEYGSIILSENGKWNRVYTSSPLANTTANRKKGNTYKAFTEKKVIVADIAETSRAHPELKKQGIKSTIFIPLSYQDKTLGVLTLNTNKKIEKSAGELKALKLFGSMATLVIRKAQLYKETKDALETRDFFISLASHELRTPLTSINGYIQLMHSRITKGEVIEKKWVNELYEESKRLTNLVQELLEINRIKQGTLQFILRECDVKEIIDMTIKIFQENHPSRSIKFTTSVKDKAIIVGDQEKLIEVLRSILHNAVKFSEDDSLITIKLTKKKSDYFIQIIDEGVGIEREDIMKIFEGFYKPDTHMKEGIGVGLMLAKHIIKYHQGTIQILSSTKKGTTVQICLPVFEG